MITVHIRLLFSIFLLNLLSFYCRDLSSAEKMLPFFIYYNSFFFVIFHCALHSFLGERSRAIREVNLRAKQLSEPAVMYFHICETKALNRWKLVSYYEKGKESGRGEGGEKKKRRERRDEQQTREEHREEEKERGRKVETENKRKIKSTVFFFFFFNDS